MQFNAESDVERFCFFTIYLGIISILSLVKVKIISNGLSQKTCAGEKKNTSDDESCVHWRLK